MFKCKLAEALAIAASLGYAGSQTDPAAVKAFLVEKNPAVENSTAPGQTVDWKTVEIEGETKRLTLTLTPSLPATQAAAGSTATATDIDVLVKAKVADALKAAGLSKPDRPRMFSEESIKGVKSGEERMYEDRIKAGDAFCSSYAVAKGMHAWLCAKIVAGTPGWDDGGTERAKYQKSLGEWASHVGVDSKAYDTFASTGGSATVPEMFQAELIRNVLDYGVYNRLSRVVPMTGPQLIWAQRTGGVTGSYPLENVAPSVSTGTTNNISLNAKTFQVLQQASNQILADSGVAFMDWIMQEAAMAIAKQKDDVLLIGNASGTYAGATGYEFKYGATATDGGYVVVGGGDATAHTAANLVSCIARLPQNYRAGAAWTCSPTIASQVFDRLAAATPGGVTWREFEGLGYVRSYLGFPIIENNSMSSVTDANATNRTGFTAGDQIDILFGNFSRASMFGELMGMEIAVDTSAGFTAYSTYIAARCRFDSNIFNIGTSTTASAVISFWQT